MSVNKKIHLHAGAPRTSLPIMDHGLEKGKRVVPDGFHHIQGDFSIRIFARFEASHYLYAYYSDGSNEPLHGHSWTVELFLSRADAGTARDGLGFDFVEARHVLSDMAQHLDHTCINDLADFSGVNPTSENLARWFYAGLESSVRDRGGLVREIRIHEGPDNIALFRPAESVPRES